MGTGPGLQLSQMETRARLVAQDSDTVNPGVLSAQYTDIINRLYLSYFCGVEKRIKWAHATTAGLNIDGSVTPVVAKTISDTNLPRILDVVGLFHEGTDIAAITTTAGQPLERARDPLEILSKIGNLAAASVVPLSGTPQRFAVVRFAAEPTTATLNRGAVTIYFDKYITDARRCYSVMVVQSPTLLSAANDTPDVSPEGSYLIADMAGAVAARLLLREPQFIEGIVDTVPSDRERLAGYNRMVAEAYAATGASRT
jgi:hypothetical protein